MKCRKAPSSSDAPGKLPKQWANVARGSHQSCMKHTHELPEDDRQDIESEIIDSTLEIQNAELARICVDVPGFLFLIYRPSQYRFLHLSPRFCGNGLEFAGKRSGDKASHATLPYVLLADGQQARSHVRAAMDIFVEKQFEVGEYH